MPPPLPPQVGSKSERLQLHQRNFPASTSNHPSRIIRSSSSSSFIIHDNLLTVNSLLWSLKTSQGSSSSYPSPPSPPVTSSLTIMFHPENAFQVQFRSLASLLRLHFFPQVGIDQFRINQLCKSPLQCNRLLTERIIFVICSSVISFFDSPSYRVKLWSSSFFTRPFPATHESKEKEKEEKMVSFIFLIQ